MADYDAVIEIPKGSRNKYEVDHETGRVFLDRVLFTALRLPHRLRLLREHPRPRRRPGRRARAARVPALPRRRRQGAPGRRFNMTDDGGSDAKVIAVPAKDPRWAHIQDITDIPEFTRKEIEHFFEHYKDLEPGKWVKTEGWGDAAEAEAIVQAGHRGLRARRPTEPPIRS